MIPYLAWIECCLNRFEQSNAKWSYDFKIDIPFHGRITITITFLSLKSLFSFQRQKQWMFYLHAGLLSIWFETTKRSSCDFNVLLSIIIPTESISKYLYSSFFSKANLLIVLLLPCSSLNYIRLSCLAPFNSIQFNQWNNKSMIFKQLIPYLDYYFIQT